MEGIYPKFKILYVGDEISFIEQLKSAEDRFEVIIRKNGLLAINWLTDNKFVIFHDKKELGHKTISNLEIDAVICDIYISGMNGFDFYRELKSYNNFVNIPFILVTNKFHFTLRRQAFYIGIDDYYSFPINLDNLYERINFLKTYKNEIKISDVYSKELDIKSYKTPFLKRYFDIIIAGGTIVILSPLLLLIALSIRIESKGKVYYISKRVGANYNVFDFYKFRSMYANSDNRIKEVEHLNIYEADEVEDICPRCLQLEEGKYCSPIVYYDGDKMCEYIAIKKKNAKKAFLKIKDDPRITKVGNFIRNTSIDELPQLFNILKGDMSIVGNRPLPLTEAEAITKQGWGKRFQAAAGLTGLWQVELRGRDGIMSEEERFKLDNEYADNNSFWGDIKLILRTFKIFIQKENV